MSTSSTEGQGQESTQGQGGQGQESTANGGQGQESGATGQSQGQGQQGDQGDEFDLSKVQDPAVKSYLEKVQRDAKEAREEAARYRTERNDLKTKVTEHERANETEVQRRERETKERDEETERLRQEVKSLRVGTVVKDAATKARAFNPDVVLRMIAGSIETGEDGKPTNVDALLKDLKKSDPYLFRREGSNDAGHGNENGDEGGTPLNMNDQLRRAAGKQ